MLTIEELEHRLKKLEHEDTPPDSTPPIEPSQETHKKELPKKDIEEQKIEPVKRDEDGDPIEPDEDEDDDGDPIDPDEERYNIKKSDFDKLMADISEKARKETLTEIALKEKLRPITPPEIKTLTKIFTCEACKYPLGDRQFVPCPDCGWKMKTQLELMKEEQDEKKRLEDDKKKIRCPDKNCKGVLSKKYEECPECGAQERTPEQQKKYKDYGYNDRIFEFDQMMHDPKMMKTVIMNYRK